MAGIDRDDRAIARKRERAAQKEARRQILQAVRCWQARAALKRIFRADEAHFRAVMREPGKR